MSESSLTASSPTTVSHRCAKRIVKEGLYRPAATWEAFRQADKSCRDMLACKASADASSAAYMICQLLHKVSEGHEVRMSHIPKDIGMSIASIAVDDDKGWRAGTLVSFLLRLHPKLCLYNFVITKKTQQMRCFQRVRCWCSPAGNDNMAAQRLSLTAAFS